MKQKIKLLFLRWRPILLIFITIKIILLLHSTFILYFNGPSLSFQSLLQIWHRWDGPQYLIIAQEGYGHSGLGSLVIVFYPLYPLLIKSFNFFVQNYILSALLISSLFSLLTSIFLYELTILDYKRRTAILAVWFLNIYPTSYFLSASYTESLFLATSIGSLLFLRQKHYVASGLVGMLANLTRVNGLLLLPILLWENKGDYKKIIYLLLLPIGFLIYIGINYYLYDDPLYFQKPLFSNWYKRLDWPWYGLSNLIKYLDLNSYYGLRFFYELVFIIFIFTVGIYTFIKVRISYGIYILLNLLLFLSTSFILSTPRYSLILFPIFITLATIKQKIVTILISIVFLFLLVLFSNWYLNGQWAF